MDLKESKDAGHRVCHSSEAQTTLALCPGLSDSEKVAEKRRILRNVIVISLVFMALFTNNTANLLSSLFPEVRGPMTNTKQISNNI